MGDKGREDTMAAGGTDKFDYIIIGGGIVGSSIAREIASRGLGSVAVLDKEPQLGLHGSGRNSGVLHSGINQKPGSLKARMAVEGNCLAREFCRQNGVRMEECGTIVVSRNERELDVLNTLVKMGTAAGVGGLRIMDRDELAEREPSTVGTNALLSPNGAIVDSEAFVRAVAEDAGKHGAAFIMNARVTGIHGRTVISTAGDFEAGHMINCAGLYSDRVASMMGTDKGRRIIPFRGEYMELEGLKVNSMVYQAPDLKYPFLGVHFTKTVDGDVLAGPTAMLSFGREAYDKQIIPGDSARMIATVNFWRLVSSRKFLRLVWQNGKISFSDRAFLAEILTLAKGVEMSQIKPYRSGIRAQMVDRSGRMVDDMVVEYLDGSTHVLNAVSPGMTAALAFASHVVDNMLSRR
jgi:(S)-2-hydroxyglutarate dehydrogenase